MNSLPHNTVIPSPTYMNGAPIAAGGNPSFQSSVMDNGVMGGGLMMGQMPISNQMAPNAAQHQAALYHYQQQLQAQQMNPYVKAPAQMMNTGNIMMGPPQEGSSTHIPNRNANTYSSRSIAIPLITDIRNSICKHFGHHQYCSNFKSKYCRSAATTIAHEPCN